MIEKEKLLIDTAIAAPAITIPWWAQIFEAWAQFGIVSLTLIVVLFRVHIAWKDWKSK
jgi:hypothetical protein|tara:strand:+ start:147 stop:320 length:174 start_codon:yes stop_codon:yes gene_type:complete